MDERSTAAKKRVITHRVNTQPLRIVDSAYAASCRYSERFRMDKQVHCPYPGCKWIGPLRSLWPHRRDDHIWRL